MTFVKQITFFIGHLKIILRTIVKCAAFYFSVIRGFF